MKRLTGSITVALVALTLFVAPVSAGWQWCAKDPVVSLNGTAVQIFVAVPQQYVSVVSGPIAVQIALPGEVDREVIFLDAGFNGYGELVQFQPTAATVAEDGSFDIRVRAYVPVSGRLGIDIPVGGVPLQVTVITNGELIWENGLPVVINGETTVAESATGRAYVDVTVQGSN